MVVFFYISAIYCLILLYTSFNFLLCIFNRYSSNQNRLKITEKFDELPKVTIQIPLHNDAHVGVKCIETATEIDYPVDKFEIQALDDSTEAFSKETIKKCVEKFKEKGFDIHYISRQNRIDYKAGNLRNGMNFAKGDFVAIFDSDARIDKNFLTGVIHLFTDSNVCFVQSAISPLNSDESKIASADALWLDSEQSLLMAGNNWNGYFITFNGSAGIWRSQILKDLGGWTGDSLAEDRDLSYRAYIEGYKSIYAGDVVTLQEVPATLEGQRIQKSRWFKGIHECNLIYFKKLLSANLPFKQKFFSINSMLLESTIEIKPFFQYFFLTMMLLKSYDFTLSDPPFFKAEFIYGLIIFYTLSVFLNFLSSQIVLNKPIKIYEIFKRTIFWINLNNDLENYYKFNHPGIFKKRKTEFQTTPKTGNCTGDELKNNEHCVNDHSKYDTCILIFNVIYFIFLICNPKSYYIIPFFLFFLPVYRIF